MQVGMILSVRRTDLSRWYRCQVWESAENKGCKRNITVKLFFTEDWEAHQLRELLFVDLHMVYVVFYSTSCKNCRFIMILAVTLGILQTRHYIRNKVPCIPGGVLKHRQWAATCSQTFQLGWCVRMGQSANDACWTTKTLLTSGSNASLWTRLNIWLTCDLIN